MPVRKSVPAIINQICPLQEVLIFFLLFTSSLINKHLGSNTLQPTPHLLIFTF